jgi:hypothetical protein
VGPPFFLIARGGGGSLWTKQIWQLAATKREACCCIEVAGCGALSDRVPWAGWHLQPMPRPRALGGSVEPRLWGNLEALPPQDGLWGRLEAPPLQDRLQAWLQVPLPPRQQQRMIMGGRLGDVIPGL